MSSPSTRTSVIDLLENFNSALDLVCNEFQAVMRAEREERLQDQQLQHKNSEVLQGRSNPYCEDINELFVKYHKIRDQGNDLDKVQHVTNHWLGLAHDCLCKCPPNNILPLISCRPFPTAPEPIKASHDWSNSGLSYATVPIKGEDVVPGSSTSGLSSSDPGFILFHLSVPSSSNLTTHDTAEYDQETPSLLTIQEEELIELELEDCLMREDAERRMNAPGRTHPGGVHQGRIRLSMSVNLYPHKKALGEWSFQHTTESRKRRSVQQGGQRGQPFIIPGVRGDQADDSGRGGATSSAAEKAVWLLSAFDPSRTAGSSLRSGCDEQGSGLGPVGLLNPQQELEAQVPITSEEGDNLLGLLSRDAAKGREGNE